MKQIYSWREIGARSNSDINPLHWLDYLIQIVMIKHEYLVYDLLLLQLQPILPSKNKTTQKCLISCCANLLNLNPRELGSLSPNSWVF